MAHSDELKMSTINEKFRPKEIPPLEKWRTKEIPAVKPDVVHIENNSRSAFEARVRSLQESSEQKSDSESSETNHEGLTDEEKAKVKEAHPDWSDEIIDSFENMEQYEICKNADLREVEINGRKCLIRDIDWDYIDPKTLLTNRERVENDLVPIDSKTGEKIELHHLGQKFDGPFAELTENSEHGDGNHKILHPHNEGSWRNTQGNIDQYNNERKEHWKTRSEMEA